MADAWRMLYEQGVDVVLNGHDHGYERFSPMDTDGRPDALRSIRQFIVGTGGAPLYLFTASPNSEQRIAAYGVLQLTMRADGYQWAFIDAATRAPADSGSGVCH